MKLVKEKTLIVIEYKKLFKKYCSRLKISQFNPEVWEFKIETILA